MAMHVEGGNSAARCDAAPQILEHQVDRARNSLSAIDRIRLAFLSASFAGLFIANSGWAQTRTPVPICTEETWASTSTTNAPAARYWNPAIWTGHEMIVWGGFAGSNDFDSGGRYNPGTDSWTTTSTVNAPTARRLHTAVWTGKEMIVWGFAADSTGGKYDPVTNSWTATSTTNVPTARVFHTAVWTGTEMIVWGGSFDGSTAFATGGKYNPSTDSWTATNSTNAPTARRNHTAVWTGSEMIVWGGYSNQGTYNTGAKYNPVTDSWTAMNATNAPTARWFHTAVWTGREMIVWGGFDGGTYYNTGGKYDPGTDTWTPMSTVNAPTARILHPAVWTGSEMIVWGGYDGGGSAGIENTGARYDPATDRWTATGTANAPTVRYWHNGIWTGTNMIVWGGYGGSYLNTGGRYCAQPVTTPNISGTVLYCVSAVAHPVPSVTLTLTGTSSGSTLSTGSGNYTFNSLTSGGNYTVTPTKMAHTPGSSVGIDTLDVIAVQRHFLNIALLSGCQIDAADVNGDTAVNTSDVIAIQRFYLGLTFGIGSTGNYRFNPRNRIYSGLATDQTAQDYDALVFGDVVAPFSQFFDPADRLLVPVGQAVNLE